MNARECPQVVVFLNVPHLFMRRTPKSWSCLIWSARWLEFIKHKNVERGELMKIGQPLMLMTLVFTLAPNGCQRGLTVRQINTKLSSTLLIHILRIAGAFSMLSPRRQPMGQDGLGVNQAPRVNYLGQRSTDSRCAHGV